MLRRLLSFGLLLPATLALADLPCKTQEEAMAEAVVGYFMVQRISAERCDALLGGDALSSLHRRIEQRFAAQVTGARTLREGYFRRAYGANAPAELARVHELMTDLFTTTLAVDETNCGGLKDALQARLAGDWEPIRQRLERRVRGIAGTDQGVCKE